MENVVITGMGAVTSLGNNVNELWSNIIDGKCGIDTIKRIDPEKLETKVAAEIKDDSYEAVAKKFWSRRQLNGTTKAVRILLAAAAEAVEDSGIDFENYNGDRAAVIMGIADNSYDENEKVKPTSITLKTMPSLGPALISEKFGIHGACFNLSCACSSSGYAIAMAAQLIESGVYDMVITGANASMVNEERIKGFNQVLAMSVNPDPKTACRPFTKNRDGFIMGEGSGVMVLESESSAKRRNARIYAKLSGYACYSEAANMTAPLEEGEGMRIVMSNALSKAGISPEKVDYINAHGTSTYLNDKCETIAIKKLFGDHAKEISVSSSKSAIGHTLNGGSVIEGIITVKAINDGIAPPTVNYDEADPDLDLDYTPNTAKKREINTAVSNSFGFGGQNVSLVFEKI